MDPVEFKNRIMRVIHSDEFSIVELKNLLTPISSYTDNPLFSQNIRGVVDILTKDRDGNHKFNIDDLKLLGQDIIGITSLITSILLVIGAIPELKLRYDAGATEELICKLLAYVFLVIIPQQTGQKWTLAEKESVLDLTILIYQLIRSSQMVKNIVAKIAGWFKSSGVCDCCLGIADDKADVLEKRLPKVKLELTHAVNNVRDKSAIQKQIKDLQTQIETYQQKDYLRNDSV